MEVEIASRLQGKALMPMFSAMWRPLLIGLAVATLSISVASAQGAAERANLCATCHGEDGNSRMPNIPSLAGQPEFFIINQLFLMREGVRKVDAMAPLVKDLTDADLDGLSKHYAALPAKASGEKVDAALAQKGAAVATQRGCGSCHLPTLAGQEQMPRLAKQRIDYLVPTLKSYRDAPRPGADTAMSAAIAGASDDDIAALANYAASR
jgi:cytochrome c553